MSERTRRTRTQWLELFQPQADLQLNIVDSCRQENINDRYYSKRKKELLDDVGHSTGGFIKLSNKNKGSYAGGPNRMILHYYQTQLELVPSIDPRWMAALLKSLT